MIQAKMNMKGGIINMQDSLILNYNLEFEDEILGIFIGFYIWKPTNLPKLHR
jgi:hypothetical protein